MYLHVMWIPLKRQTRATYGCMTTDQSPWSPPWTVA